MNDRHEDVSPFRAWPPLLGAENVPWWVRARDVILTLAAWFVLAFFLRTVIFLAWDWLRPPFGRLTAESPPDLATLWQHLQPFVIVAIVLIAWLTFWGVRRRAWLGPKPRQSEQPAALDRESHVARFGLTLADATPFQAARVVTVRFDDRGRITGCDVDRWA